MKNMGYVWILALQHHRIRLKPFPDVEALSRTFECLGPQEKPNRLFRRTYYDKTNELFDKVLEE